MQQYPTSVRLPAELREWIEERSYRHIRSLSAEIVAVLDAVRRGEQHDEGFKHFASPFHRVTPRGEGA